ncbi:hypothetical protein [Roseibium suaedae]|uniref:Uncharacterized protein n=1 Tax=Roseibium suaedae TaxID=735517 RepID=A0A1M7N831_9HYPH|nr:hypothetical protein [Roseibium suaedae]SHM99775.1 hypothetical protein SAMN05444272_3754 [Roseibium suaedae]
MGKTARLELLRRMVPLALFVLGITGGFTFLSPISALLCLAAAVGVYAAMPRPKVPAGALRAGQPVPTTLLDLIGFLIGVPLFCMGFLGAAYGGSGAAAMLLLLLPACLSFFVFMASIRQETSWVRFFGNGFEMTQLGMKIRIRYEDLGAVRLREVRTRKGIGAVLSSMFVHDRRRIEMLANANETTTLNFVTRGGTQFAFSSEMIPDLQRVLIGLDRAGVELPQNLSDRQRDKIRRTRERLYGSSESSNAEQLDVARIANTVRLFHERRNRQHRS